ncbi:Uncharacterized protein dnm_011130 [Desulfonema magnum]|uniref:Uncharacterized protein n=1 Tax=Desulfonema magnum TaxID=45655 RepID=A0A975GKY7_9BACT|nr:Uncharacterized protein dnm_011130 [Desulfonema magnum]
MLLIRHVFESTGKEDKKRKMCLPCAFRGTVCGTVRCHPCQSAKFVRISKISE